MLFLVNEICVPSQSSIIFVMTIKLRLLLVRRNFVTTRKPFPIPENFVQSVLNPIYLSFHCFHYILFRKTFYLTLEQGLVKVNLIFNWALG